MITASDFLSPGLLWSPETLATLVPAPGPSDSAESGSVALCGFHIGSLEEGGGCIPRDPVPAE